MTESRRKTWLLLAIVAIAFNLRASLTAIGPVSGMLQTSLGLSSGAAGFVTTIPLLAFGVMSPLVSRLAERLGEGRTILLAFLCMAVGLLVRAYLGVVGLFLGTVCTGMGIAVGNVLLPALVKDGFPGKDGLMTGIYTSCMSICASVAVAVSVPLALAFGWRQSLAVWVLLVAAAVLIFLPFRDLRLRRAEGGSGAEWRAVLHSPVTAWLSLYMGVQSMFFYSFVAWMPAVLAYHGFSATAAGYLSSVYQLMGIPVGFLTPLIAGKRDQRKFIAAVSVLYVAAMAVLIFAHAKWLVGVGVFLCGVCASATFSLAMLLFTVRASTPAVSAALSGVAQSVGYLIAAVGPFCMGYLFDRTQNWTVTLLALAAVILPLAVSGWQAAKDRYI